MHRATRLPESAFDRAHVRRRRLERLIERVNRLHCRRRVLGLPTAWLIPRSRRLTRAFLDARHAELTAR